MLHIKNGGTVKINPVEFNESYMMHGSTSPQYNMIASLDVATKMMDDNGEVMMRDIIREAIQLRKEVARLNREFKAKKDWFFDMWQPRKVRINGKTLNSPMPISTIWRTIRNRGYQQRQSLARIPGY
ncbi:MAG: hypothetical protein V8T87_01745 [Victivallales bacterium]